MDAFASTMQRLKSLDAPPEHTMSTLAYQMFSKHVDENGAAITFGQYATVNAQQIAEALNQSNIALQQHVLEVASIMDDFLFNFLLDVDDGLLNTVIYQPYLASGWRDTVVFAKARELLHNTGLYKQMTTDTVNHGSVLRFVRQLNSFLTTVFHRGTFILLTANYNYYHRLMEFDKPIECTIFHVIHELYQRGCSSFITDTPVSFDMDCSSLRPSTIYYNVDLDAVCITGTAATMAQSFIIMRVQDNVILTKWADGNVHRAEHRFTVSNRTFAYPYIMSMLTSTCLTWVLPILLSA